MTPYLRFHPGGADTLLEAAGKDGTALFNTYHAWVNAGERPAILSYSPKHGVGVGGRVELRMGQWGRAEEWEHAGAGSASGVGWRAWERAWLAFYRRRPLLPARRSRALDTHPAPAARAEALLAKCFVGLLAPGQPGAGPAPGRT